MRTWSGRSPRALNGSPLSSGQPRITALDRAEQKVRCRSRERHDEHVGPGVPEAVRIHRHRLRPADHRCTGERTERGQDDRAERIDVRNRVQGEPVRALGRVVAEPQRDHAVTDLVEDHRHDERDEVDDGDVVDRHGVVSDAGMRR